MGKNYITNQKWTLQNMGNLTNSQFVRRKKKSGWET